jgi:MFS family permease
MARVARFATVKAQMTTSLSETPAVFTTDVPARLDRLPWSRFHWLVALALGVTWVLDGLEVTLVSSLAGAIADRRGLHLSSAEVGLAASIYLSGAVLGALSFGRLTDSLGRKRLFTATVGLYCMATLLSGLSWNFWSFALFRFFTGAGIGGEVAAMNSAVQELIPARRRGVTDLVINGSYWLGAGLAALGAVVLLDPRLVPQWLGWRLAFLIGGALALFIIYIRRLLPESPRWLMTHGRIQEAEDIVRRIESRVALQHGPEVLASPAAKIALIPRRSTGVAQVARTLLRTYPKRTALGLILMATQAFCYNAIFFTYALILTTFYGVPNEQIGWFLLPFAAGNFLGPLMLGRLFDHVGRRPMICLTYALAGALLVLTGWLFLHGLLDARSQTLAWTVVFFFASAAASAAYLTVGECFPLEARALSIAFFYAVGTGVGGVAAPAIFGALIGSGSRIDIFYGYLFGGGLMILASVAEGGLGVRSERRPLEEVAPPLSSAADRRS